jgi:predicted Fe-S protein YdhL (DUF1289 family)
MSILGDGATDTGCVGICTTLFDPVCQGCGRTAYEVDNWVFLTEDEREVARQRSREFKSGHKSED